MIRWFQSRVIILQLWSFIELALPILLLADYVQIGFSAKTAAIIMIALKLVNVALTIRARRLTNAAIGTKAEVAAGADFTGDVR